MLVGLWIAATLWAFSRQAIPVAFVSLQVWFLAYVTVPAVHAVVSGRTTIGPYDFTAGTQDALILASVAQAFLLFGTALARLGNSARPVRIEVDLPPGLLDRWILGLFAAGLALTLAYVLVSGAPISTLNSILGSGRYGDLERAGDGVTLKALKAGGSLVGAALLAGALRLSQGHRVGRGLVILTLAAAALVLGVRGARLWLFLPAIAAGLLWWKTSNQPMLRGGRALILVVAGAVLVGGSLLAGLRGQSEKRIDLSAFVGSEVDVGVFVPMAGLVDTVPEASPYLWGESYLEALALPVPRALWEGKPQGALRDQQRTFITRDIGASVAFPGELYANAGLPAVAVGCMGFAFLLERTWLSFARTSHLGHSVWLAAVVVVLLQVFSRSNPGSQLAGQIGLLAGALWLMRRIDSGHGSALPTDGPRVSQAVVQA